MRAACRQSDADPKGHHCELVDLMQIATPNSQRVLRTTHSGTGRWIVEQFESADLNGKKIKQDATPWRIFLHDGKNYVRVLQAISNNGGNRKS
jgi:hypothetical protein